MLACNLALKRRAFYPLPVTLQQLKEELATLGRHLQQMDERLVGGGRGRWELLLRVLVRCSGGLPAAFSRPRRRQGGGSFPSF